MTDAKPAKDETVVVATEPVPAPDQNYKGTPEQQEELKVIQQQLQELKERAQLPSFVPAESEEAKKLVADKQAIEQAIQKDREAVRDAAVARAAEKAKP